MRGKLLLIAALLSGGAAVSSASVAAPACRIEHWKAQQKGDAIRVNGRTSCADGIMSFSLFDAKSGEYIGSSRAFIGGHVFTDYVDGYASGGLRIEYSIE